MSDSKKQGKLFVLSGPSGVGKGTVCRMLDWKKLDLNKSVSMTTRGMRQEDAEGITYYFVSEQEFEQNIKEGNFLEWARFNNTYYGTPRKAVEKWLEEGHNVLLEIETQGAAQIMKNYPDCVSIFLVPPRKEDLLDRLHTRGSEEEENIQARYEQAEREMAQAVHYDYTVVNDRLEDTVRKVDKIIADACA